MRTTGTFRDVYDSAMGYLANNHGKPHEPVVRYNPISGEWCIESHMNQRDRGTLETSLDDFTDYWYDVMMDDPYGFTDEDVAEYINILKGE
jgi:hypothetical protein